jgi:hypothetical protein
LSVPGRLPLQEGEALQRRQLPHPRGIARDSFTGRACGREVTVGDASAVDTPLSDLRDEVRRRMGHQASGLADACDEVTTTVAYFWPQKWMAHVARTHLDPMPATIVAVDVIEAKVREDLEARFGTDGNTLRTLDLLVGSVVTEFAGMWFAGAEVRIAMRRAMWQARQR